MSVASIPRLCLVIPMPPPYGGMANWSRMVVDELQNRGVEFDVIDTSTRRRSVDGRTLYERFLVRGFDIFRMKRHLARSIRRGSKVVHIAASGSFAVIRDIVLLRYARRRGVATVYHLHFGRVSDIQRRNTWEWRALHLAISLSSVTLAIDRTTFEALSTVVDPERLAYVPNPIEMESLPRAGTPEHHRVMFLGWLIPSKGVSELLEAWGRFYSEHPDWTLQLVGPVDPDTRSRLESTYSLAGVDMCGEQDHAKAMRTLSECSIFILPSYSEGFPYALLEAMALGKAAIATRVGSIPDMLAGECGVLVDPHSWEDILQALEQFANDPEKRTQCGRRAQAKAREEYDLQVVLPQYIHHWASRA